MLGVGWTEMLVIGVVALIVIGPKDLPVVMQKIGRFAGQIRRMGNEFTREINRTTGLDEVRNLRNSITQPLKQTADEIRREFNVMTPSGVSPSGAIQPADPAGESVADEIRAAAGMAPAVPAPASDTPANLPAVVEPGVVEPAPVVKAKRTRTPRVRAAVAAEGSPVETTAPTTRRRRAQASAELASPQAGSVLKAPARRSRAATPVSPEVPET